jgi:hypothetical protein
VHRPHPCSQISTRTTLTEPLNTSVQVSIAISLIIPKLIFRITVIQGYADLHALPDAPPLALTKDELKATLEFCAQAYIPIDPEDKTSKAKVDLVGFMAMSETIEALACGVIDGRRIRLETGALGLERY